MKKIYLDYNSTTPVHHTVFSSMVPYFTEVFGNPSTLHSFGREASEAVELARSQVASLINAKSEEIIFTSGGTEANSLAIGGLIKIYAAGKKHIITSAIEHSSVYQYCRKLEDIGLSVTYLPVDSDGLVNVMDVEKALTPQTALISIMLANNETGTVQSIKQIAELASDYKVLMHTDAVQAVGKIPVDVHTLGVDMMSISGHKMYAPKGVGALYKRNGVILDPLFYGGGQEGDVRSGTENVPGIVALGSASLHAEEAIDVYSSQVAELRDYLQDELLIKINCAKVNCQEACRIPNTLNMSFPGYESETLIAELDLAGIAVTAASACAARQKPGSRILRALDLPANELYSSVRFSLGLETTKVEIDYTIESLCNIIEKL